MRIIEQTERRLIIRKEFPLLRRVVFIGLGAVIIYSVIGYFILPGCGRDCGISDKFISALVFGVGVVGYFLISTGLLAEVRRCLLDAESGRCILEVSRPFRATKRIAFDLSDIASIGVVSEREEHEDVVDVVVHRRAEAPPVSVCTTIDRSDAEALVAQICEFLGPRWVDRGVAE